MTQNDENTLEATRSLTLSNDGVVHEPSREAIVDAFLSRMSSTHTRRAYRRHIETALDVIAVPLRLITGQMLARYRSRLVETAPAPSASQALSLIHISEPTRPY